MYIIGLAVIDQMKFVALLANAVHFHERVLQIVRPGADVVEAGRELRGLGGGVERFQCVVDVGLSRTPELSVQYGLTIEEVGQIYRVIGDLMYRAVRIGGVPCSGLPWRWGYGWPECK